jgi:hypothetical protein
MSNIFIPISNQLKKLKNCLPRKSYNPTNFMIIKSSNGNDIETKAKESFDNGVFFYIETKLTHSMVRKLFSK